MKRTNMKRIILGALLFLVAAMWAPAMAQQKNPNILVIWGDVGFQVLVWSAS